MLNERDKERGNEYENITDGWKHNEFHQRTRLYGDYLRSQDIDMFNENYYRYLDGNDEDMNKLNKYL